MSASVKDIVLDLRRKYNVDEYYYPAISMDIDVPKSLLGEATRISQLLEKNGFRVNSENVFNVMKLKKLLLKRYSKTEEGKRAKAVYSRLILEDIRPTGITIPLDLLMVDGVLVLLLFVAYRFLGSFADEAGKMAARKLLGDDEKNAAKHNMTLVEYSFHKNQATFLVERETNLKIIEDLQREEEK